MNRLLPIAMLSSLFILNCGGSKSSGGGGGGGHASGSGDQSSGSGLGGSFTSGSSGAGSSSTTLQATIRDFRYYDANDSTTNPDFENPPYMFDKDGNPVSHFDGPWDDLDIVTDTLGADGKPVYKNDSGTTLTTHGKASFDMWYNDVSGTNINVPYPLPITQESGGTFGYDSNVSGVAYNYGGQMGKGFFPIDNGGKYATSFGNQGKPHNYSFTMELHTLFMYMGGETFKFRGDDDVFVYVNGSLVINVGGIHGPEEKDVNIDDLGLTVGMMYPLDFFSAERHETGSNIKFTTTLVLQTVPPPM